MFYDLKCCIREEWLIQENEFFTKKKIIMGLKLKKKKNLGFNLFKFKKISTCTIVKNEKTGQHA